MRLFLQGFLSLLLLAEPLLADIEMDFVRLRQLPEKFPHLSPIVEAWQRCSLARAPGNIEPSDLDQIMLNLYGHQNNSIAL